MKKIFLTVAAVALLAACNNEREYLDYRGLSMKMKPKDFADSLAKRGFAVDSAASGEDQVVMRSQKEHYSVTIASEKDTILVVQEDYTATYNDSTRNLFQTLRDEYAKSLSVTPYIPDRGDDHKTAVFQTSKGTVTIILENTYTPTLSVKFDRHIVGK